MSFVRIQRMYKRAVINDGGRREPWVRATARALRNCRQLGRVSDARYNVLYDTSNGLPLHGLVKRRWHGFRSRSSTCFNRGLARWIRTFLTDKTTRQKIAEALCQQAAAAASALELDDEDGTRRALHSAADALSPPQPPSAA